MSFQARADTSFSSEMYDDANELYSKIKDATYVGGGGALGVGFTGSPITVNVGGSGSRHVSLLKVLSKYQNKVFKHNACVAQYSITYTEHVLP